MIIDTVGYTRLLKLSQAGDGTATGMLQAKLSADIHLLPPAVLHACVMTLLMPPPPPPPAYVPQLPPIKR